MPPLILTPSKTIERVPLIVQPSRRTAKSGRGGPMIGPSGHYIGFSQVRGRHCSPIMVNPFFLAGSIINGNNLVAAIGGFNAPSSSTTGTTVTVSGLPFQPKWLLFWMEGGTQTDDTAALATTGTARASMGMTDGSAQYAWGVAHLDNSNFTNLGAMHRNDCCVMRAGFRFNENTYRGLNLSAINSDGFTLQIDSNGTLAWAGDRIKFLALGGSDLTLTQTVSTMPAGTGNSALTPYAFQPVALFHLNFAATVNVYNTATLPAYGCATGSSNMWAWAGSSSHNIDTSDTYDYLRSDEYHATVVGSSVGSRFRLVSFDATGFTTNRLENSGATQFFHVGFAGIQAQAALFTASSGGGSVSGLSFQPKVILFGTHGAAESTANAADLDYTWSFGVCVAGPSQLCAHMHDVDAATTSNVAFGHRDDSVVMTTSTAGTPALDSQVAISAINTDGFSYTMPTSTRSGYKVGYLALG